MKQSNTDNIPRDKKKLCYDMATNQQTDKPNSKHNPPTNKLTNEFANITPHNKQTDKPYCKENHLGGYIL